jgi:hypothetical protein
MVTRFIRNTWPIPVVAFACMAEVSGNNMETAVPPPVITVTATDYAFEAPNTVTAGFTTFRIENQGDQMHGATVVRLESGRTLPEYIAAYGEANRTRGARPAWAKFLGGSVALPHSEGRATLYLEPGNYAWVCFVPGPDGILHLLKHNQALAFEVRPGSVKTPAPSAPEPTVTLRMLDYTFQLSAPLTLAKHVIRVENVGAEPHHALLFKLVPGKTMDDFQAWMQNNMQGEAPSTFVGAMAELSTRTEAYFEVDLSAGEYLLVCLVAGRDEVPHNAKGMIQLIRVG